MLRPFRDAPDGEDIRIVMQGEPAPEPAGMLAQLVGCSIETAPLVADTGATIGWLAPAMDDALGAIRRRKERLV